MARGGLTLWALGQCPGAHHFRGPTPAIEAILKRAPIAVKIAFARGARGDFRLPLLMTPALAQGVSPATEKKLVIVRDARIVKFAG